MADPKSLRELAGTLRKNESTPLYLQLQRLLRDAISTKLVAPDEAIPTERDLASDFHISRITVRKAVDGLVSDGILTRRQGSGTFVVGPRVEKSFSNLSSFTEDMISRGRKPSSTWLSKAAGSVTPEEAMVLGLSPGSRVYRFNRIRFADGVSMAFEYATIAGYCLASVEVVGESLYDALEQAGCRPVRALQRLRAIAATSEHADALGIEVGEPGLLIERRGFLADGRPAEFTQSFYRGSAYDVVAELNTP